MSQASQSCNIAPLASSSNAPGVLFSAHNHHHLEQNDMLQHWTFSSDALLVRRHELLPLDVPYLVVCV
jgi:hypothetical protein